MEATPEQIAAFARIEQERLSMEAGAQVQVAVTALSRAAACEELLDDGSHSEGQLYFLVRALCAEHGIMVDPVVETARRYARQIKARGR